MELEELITLTAAMLHPRVQGKNDLAIRLAIRLHDEVCQALAPLRNSRNEATPPSPAEIAPAKSYPDFIDKLEDSLNEHHSALYLGITLDDLRHAVNIGAIPFIQTSKRHKRRFQKIELDRYRREREHC